MEYLSRSLNEFKNNKEFKYHSRCAKLGITHLSFVDDLLLFIRGDLKSVTHVHQCFLNFSQASGLQFNAGKSLVYFGGVQTEVQEGILQQLEFSHGEMPFKYLGIPLTTKKLTFIQWQPVIQKIVARISSWTAKKLSYAGRVQFFLFGIHAYWSQLFVMPTKVLETIDAYCRNYLWSGINVISKKALVAWSKVCLPRPAGGL